MFHVEHGRTSRRSAPRHVHRGARRDSYGLRTPRGGRETGGVAPLVCWRTAWGLVPWYDGRDGMYSWIWRHLPGNGWVRALLSLVLIVAVVYVLFQYVFPWAEPLLPFNDVTVDNQ